MARQGIEGGCGGWGGLWEQGPSQGDPDHLVHPAGDSAPTSASPRSGWAGAHMKLDDATWRPRDDRGREEGTGKEEAAIRTASYNCRRHDPLVDVDASGREENRAFL